ncbi:hypothetical protein [Mesorhizobium sp. f-mel]
MFETTGGLAFGRFPPEVRLKPDDLHAMLTRAGIRRDIPIVAELDFGHVDPMFLLPFGARVELRAEANVIVDLIEAAVA